MANFVYQTTHTAPDGEQASTARPRWVVASVLLSFFVALAATGCGGEDGSDTEGGDGGSSSHGSGGGVNLGGGTPTRDGGTVALTAEEAAALLDAACTDVRSEGENLPAVLELVVDVSLSMDQDAPGASGDSKWDVTREALRSAVEGLPDTMSVGVLYYPNQMVQVSNQPRDPSACVNIDAGIPIAPLDAEQRALIDDSLDEAQLSGYTPTHDAYTVALEEFLVPYQTSARKFMLLITDGAPTMSEGCVATSGGGGGGGGGQVQPVPPEPIIQEVGSALTGNDVRTFVIGSPGSEEGLDGEDMRPWLSAAALAGNTDTPGCTETGPSFCHMDMTEETDFAAALAEGLAAVVGQVVDECTFAFPAEAGDGATVNADLTSVIITNEAGDATLILRDDVGECTEGWVRDAQGNIALCPTTCAAVKASPGMRVEVAFGCNSDDVITVR